MPSLSFEKRFAPRVESGDKLHSIRSRRKHPQQWLPGKPVYLFTAMRTKHCRRLGIGTLRGLREITIHHDHLVIEGAAITTPKQLTAFARADGFLTWSAFVEYFDERYGLPWSGELIQWQLLPDDGLTPATRKRRF